MRRQKLAAFVGMLLCVLFLPGCGLRPLDELYALPRPSTEYQQLQKCLDDVQQQGLEYTAPLGGENTQSVQMHDLDGDGVDEAIAYFRETSGENKPLRIYVFRQNSEGAYEAATIISGDGLAVNSVVYCQLDDTPVQEMVISWQMSGAVYALSVYSLNNYTATELLSVASYTRYSVGDLDRDNRGELTVLQLSTSDEGESRADYYDWTDGALAMVNRAPLSVEMQGIEDVEGAYLAQTVPALFVSGTGMDTEAQTRRITDILAVRDGRLENITLNPDNGSSQLMVQPLVPNQDINNDHVMEVALPVEMLTVPTATQAESGYLIDWVQYDLDGSSIPVGYTYHDPVNGWYLWVTDEWVGSVSVLREDINEGSTVERAVHFYHQSADPSTAEEFLTIYVNTGANRQTRSVSGNRVLLATEPDAIYSAEFHGTGWHCGLNGQSILEAFHLIQATWSAD